MRGGGLFERWPRGHRVKTSVMSSFSSVFRLVLVQIVSVLPEFYRCNIVASLWVVLMAFRVLNVQVKVDLYMVCHRSQLHNIYWKLKLAGVLIITNPSQNTNKLCPTQSKLTRNNLSIIKGANGTIQWPWTQGFDQSLSILAEHYLLNNCYFIMQFFLEQGYCIFSSWIVSVTISGEPFWLLPSPKSTTNTPAPNPFKSQLVHP